MCEAFVSVDGSGEGCRVGDFESDVAFPTGLERGDVHDDAAASVGRFADADGEHIFWNAKVFDGDGKCERIGRNDALVSFDVYEGFFIKVFGIDERVVDIGKDFELV